MANSRNVSYKMPTMLFEQITKRADLSGKTRNEEMRSLIQHGLQFVGSGELVIELPEGERSRGVVYLDHDTELEVLARAKKFHRPHSVELILLIAYAIEKITERDLAELSAMMKRVGQGAPLH